MEIIITRSRKIKSQSIHVMRSRTATFTQCAICNMQYTKDSCLFLVIGYFVQVYVYVLLIGFIIMTLTLQSRKKTSSAHPLHAMTSSAIWSVIKKSTRKSCHFFKFASGMHLLNQTGYFIDSLLKKRGIETLIRIQYKVTEMNDEVGNM